MDYATEMALAVPTRPKFDYTNEDILAKRMASMNKIKHPRVGDWLILDNGKYTRMTHYWDIEDPMMQVGGNEHGQYYLGNYGCSYSGSLDPGIPLELMQPTDRYKNGDVWFFNQDHHTAHNGTTFSIPFRVYKLKVPGEK